MIAAPVSKALTSPHCIVPHTPPQVDCLNELRAQLNAALAPQGTKLSVNDFIVKAAALSLRKVPAVNASWMGDFVRRYHDVDVTVAVQTPAGLMVPFVRGADKKGLAAISTEVRALAGKVRAVALALAGIGLVRFALSLSMRARCAAGMLGVDEQGRGCGQHH